MHKNFFFLILVTLADFCFAMAPRASSSLVSHSHDHEQPNEQKYRAIYNALTIALNRLPPEHSLARRDALRVIKNRADDTLDLIKNDLKNPPENQLTHAFTTLINYIERLQLSSLTFPPQQDS